MAKNPKLFETDHPKAAAFLANREAAEKLKKKRNDAADELKITDKACLRLVKDIGIRPETDEDGTAKYTVPLGDKVWILKQNPSQLSIKAKAAEPTENPQDAERAAKEKSEIEGDGNEPQAER